MKGNNFNEKAMHSLQDNVHTKLIRRRFKVQVKQNTKDEAEEEMRNAMTLWRVAREICNMKGLDIYLILHAVCAVCVCEYKLQFCKLQ